MTPHITANDSEYAKTVLMPGDPLRAKWIAETFLKDHTMVNDVRDCFGYTGTYKGKPVSVQGGGMGMPSNSIYISELFDEYNVETIIRVGTCGAISSNLKVMGFPAVSLKKFTIVLLVIGIYLKNILTNIQM